MPTALFVVAIVASLGIHLANRTTHFQECDSSGVYNIIHQFPRPALEANAGSFAKTNFLSEKTARAIVGWGPVQNIIHRYAPDIPKDKIVGKLQDLNPLALFRLGMVTFFSSSHVPSFLRAAFAVPLTSTYSFGPGLFYAFATITTTSYEGFMSLATFLTILVFHLSVVLIFLTLRNLGVRKIFAVFFSFAALFSISLYSYGHHLGSTIWNIASTVLWLFVLTLPMSDERKKLRQVSMTSAILVFFDYLIVFLWAGFVVAYATRYIFRKGTARKELVQRLLSFLRTQGLAITGILLAALLFYPPGLGNSSPASLSHIFSDLYYIILDFFSFYTHSGALNVFQFIVGLFFVFFCFFYLIKSARSRISKHFLAERSVLFFFPIALLFAILQIVGFAPARHILYMAPILLIFGGLAIQELFFKIERESPTMIRILTGFIILVAGLGFAAVYARQSDTLDNTASLTIDPEVNAVLIQDCSFNLLYKKWNAPVPVMFADDPTNLRTDFTYLYVSQTTPFPKALAVWSTYKSVSVIPLIISSSSVVSNVFFTAYNPDQTYTDPRFFHNRPNNLYTVKFKPVSIKRGM